MANTLNLGNGNWGVKKDSLLGYNSENGNFKPLAFNFTRASSATVVNKAGLIETVGSGEPRIDFLGNTKGALKLEPQRTNLVTYSEDFSNWFKIGTATITSNYGVSPDGTQNSSRLQMNASDKIYINVASSGDISFTVYLKGVGQIRLRDNTSSGLKDVTLTSEWIRYELNFNATISNFQIEQQTGVSDFEIYGAQLEQGSYATSYIPTQGSAVTRSADVSSQTVPSGIIGQTEGTIFLDSKMALQSVNNYQLFSINNGGGSDRIRILTASGNRLRFIYQLDGGALAYSFYNPTDYSDLTNLKIAFTYKSGDIKVYINGVLVDSSTNTFTIAQTLTNIDIATSSGGYNQMLFNDIKLYNTALTDAELQSLTT